MLRSLINQRLGRYYIKELLGRGGMAAVYRAADTVLQRDVALKILYPQYGDDESLVQRFQREAVTAAALEHPGIVPVYDVGEQDGMAYIAMKLLSGQTLQDRLQAAHSIDLDELLSVLRPVAAALDYAHAKGIVHRDIKPGNIFLSETPDGLRVMLTDFGIAKQLDTPGLTTTGAMIGTPDYMAPEQISGRPVDARTDIYALGMLAYRALAGRRAFEGSTQDVLLGHLYSRPVPPSQVNPALPPAVDAVIDRAIAADPVDRFARASELAAALEAVARGQVVAAAATGVGMPPALAVAPADQAATGVGLPPALVVPPAAPAPLNEAPTVRRQPPQGRVIRAASPPGAAAATAETAGASTVAGPPAARGEAMPWLAAILLALVAGGLAVALFFALSRAGGGAAPTPVPPPPPTEAPSATVEPPSATPDAGAVATATGEPAPTATETQAPTATTAPTVVTAAPPPPPPATATPTELPTATPTELPTATPTASATPTETATPTATATPTEAPLACDDDLLVGGFGRLFDDNIRVRTGLGCPLEREVAGEGSVQFFEGGMMYYWDRRNSTFNADYIYVFYGADAGEYDALSPKAVSDLGPEPTPGPDPNQPVRGFGTVYFLKPGVRELLGAPTSGEIQLQGANRLGVMQRFEQGLMLYSPIYQPTSSRSIFVLYNDGRFERFDDTPAG